MSRLQRGWRVREFAGRTGVTVKALRHYEHLGLLRPRRTPAGYRLYSPGDFERLRRILALKQVGLPLGEMRPLLDADPSALRAHLAGTREALSRERDRLVRGVQALALVEESLQHAAEDDGGLSRLADVIEMPRAISHLRRYFATWRSPGC